MEDIKSCNLEEVTKIVIEMGEKSFRAKQMYEWLHQKQARSFDEMSNLSNAFRQKCAERFEFIALREIQVQNSADGDTKKFLFSLPDGNLVESVFMRYHHGNSVCISSQVGCKMGCRFCASTLDGWERNLTPSEMLDQIYAITRITGERVSNVVVMGTGEPLDNFENLLCFIELLTDENGLNISQRNITVSTCGIVPKILELSEKQLQITLAVSLHAPTDVKRQKLMPIAKKYAISELMAACDTYFERTGRRISFEYALVAGQNDTEEEARELISLLSGRNCHVNLIPVNPIKERTYAPSAHNSIQAFKNKLEKNKINVTIRREMGQDIDGACGQLRRRKMQSASREVTTW